MHRIAFFGLLCSWFTAASFCLAQAPVGPLVVGQREDAAINDVYFLDARHGWAVGERGAIWRTDDGGLRWSQSESGVACGLSSVCFLDERRGWAAGGWTEPYTHLSHGVVLTTDDGGNSWQPLNRTLLPAVRQIQFFSPTRGVAVGRTSAHAASGVFVTDDGGRSWSPLSTDAPSTWLAAGLNGAESGLLVGRDGANATIAGRALRHGEPVGDRLRGLTAIELVDQRQAWAVGQGGLIVHTTDAGKTWRPHAGRLPAGAEACDFSAIEIVGDHVWIAGSPGSRLLHSADRGRTFQWQSSGQTVPLRAMQFVDQRRGWAVGGLGTILATSDGGTNWRRQRGGGERAAWLAVVDRADRLPLELIAQLSAGEGYLGVVHTVVRDDLEVPAAADSNRWDREREALLAAGASHADAAWQFPARQPDLRLAPERIVDVWNTDDQQGPARLEEHLVRQLRTWQPQVVVTHAASPRGEDPLAHVINQLVLKAIDSAADPNKFPWHAEALELPAWEVRKVFAISADPQRGTISVRGSQWLPRLGESLVEYVRPARGLLAARYQPPTEEYGFQLLIDRLPQGVGRREFFSGIPLEHGGEARRAEHPLPPTEVNVLQRLAARREQVQAVVAAAEQDPGGTAAMLAQVGKLTSGLAPDAAGWLLHDLAGRYYQGGHDRLAAETYRLLLVQLPEHPASGEAAQWLVQYYSSGEMAHRARQAETVQTAGGTVQPAGNSVRTVAAELPADEAGAVVPPEQAAAAALPESRRRWLQAAGFWNEQLKHARPTLIGEPSVAWPLASARRLASGEAGAAQTFQTMRRDASDATWRSCAAAELWLAGRRGECPKPLWQSRRATAKPLLDGKLDEPLWKDQRPITLTSRLKDDANFPAVAYCGYDDEFLYLAIHCGAPAALPKLQPRARRRDEDLSGRDRLRLCIDLDRDYTSYYQFEIDDRGHTAESCFGDATWNPRWFVAVDRGESSWTCEIAIPLAELTSEPINGDTAWAIGLQRTIPGHGFQSWQPQATTETLPQGFGLLMFE